MRIFENKGNKMPMDKPAIGSDVYNRIVRMDYLEREGVIGGMIINILVSAKMSPNELVACLMNEPYALAPTQENLNEIVRIMNKHKALFEVSFRKDPDKLGAETVLTII